MGDPVNLASRVENLNKQYGTTRLITESTHQLAGAKFLCRPVDKVAVKGRSGSTVLYELMCLRDAATPEQEAASIITEEAFHLYQGRHFQDSVDLIDNHLLQVQADDPALKAMRDRCARLILTPPDTDWDGTNRMLTK